MSFRFFNVVWCTFDFGWLSRRFYCLKFKLYHFGALTSKTYSFNSRPWELISVSTIDLNDSTGVSIRVDMKESEVVRILPRESSVNEEWISNKTRFFFDGFKTAQLKNSLVKVSNKRFNSFGVKQNLNTFSAFFGSVSKLKKNVLFVQDFFCNMETLVSLKTLSNCCGISNIKCSPSVKILNDETKNFIFQIDKLLISNFCLLLAANLRFEASSVNLKIRKNLRFGLFLLGSFGVSHNLSFKSYFFGVSNHKLLSVFEGRTNLSKRIKNTMKNFCVYGNSFGIRKDFVSLQKLLHFNPKIFKKNQLCFSFLGVQPNIVGSFLTGLSNPRWSTQSLISYTCGSEMDTKTIQTVQSNTILNISKSSVFFFKTVDLVSFCKNIVQESGHFFNCFGVAQMSFSIISGSKNCQSLNSILDFFLIFLDQSILKANFKKNIHLAVDKQFFLDCKSIDQKIFLRLFKTSYVATVNNFYRTNSASKLSSTLLKCSTVYKKNFQNFI